MRRLLLLAAALAPALATGRLLPAQTPAGHAGSASAARPIPYPLRPAPEFLAAVEAGTRTLDGVPGPRYWQQEASYRLAAVVDPVAKRLDGSARIAYRNRSPDTLSVLRLKLHQNLHREGAPRHEPAEVTGGIELRRVTAGRRELAEGAATGPRYGVFGTILAVWLPAPLLPGDSAVLELEWGFDIPGSGAGGRMGWEGEDLLVLAYWYPQMEVYDDVVGWHDDPFTGRAEFYAGFGEYEVAIEAPAGWVVAGTGALANPEEVLAAPVLERLRRAEGSDEVVRVLGPDDLGPGRATREAPGGRLTWRLRAGRVRDFAFALTRRSVWDAVRAPVGDRDGDGEPEWTRVDALYRETATRWREAARYGRHAISFLSRWLDYPYPWPHMTAVEAGGMIGGGMEYPMMTAIDDYEEATDAALYAVIAHEFAHMWLPMVASSDETRHAFLDEGTTSFHENRAEDDFYPGVDHDREDIETYLEAVAAGLDGAMMEWTDWERPGAWSIAAYPKPASALAALRALIGEEAFRRGLTGYMDAWAYRHPTPWDFFHAFQRAAGRDLGWFWRSWYFEEWTLDHAIAGVRESGGATAIAVEDRGDLPLPARLTIRRADGQVLEAQVPVETWLAGARTATVEVPPGARVERVELDAGRDFPDRDRSNDIWVR